MKLEEKLLKFSDSELEFLVKNAKRVNLLLYDSVVHLPYWLVKVELPNLLSGGEFTAIFEILSQYLQKDIQRLGVSELFGFILWLRDGLETVSDMEARHLSTVPDPKLVKAGIRNLDVLGELNVIDALAGGDILKWDAVKQLPYHQVFDKLLKMKLEQEIQLKIIS